MQKPESKKILSDNLKKLIAENKKTQSAICSDLSISPTTFSDWINGKTYPRIENLTMLAVYFDVPLSKLIDSNTPKDIKKSLDDVISALKEQACEEKLTYNNKHLSKETYRLIKVSLENTMRLINEIIIKNIN